MFQRLAQFFGSFADESPSGRNARRTLNRALLFGGLLVALWLATEYLLPAPAPDGPPVVSDQSGSVAATPDERGAEDSWHPGLVVALLLLGGGIALAVHLRRDSSTAAGSTGPMSVVARQSLGADRELALVSCAGEILLLALSSDGVRLIKTYDRDRFPDLHAPPPGGDGAPAHGGAMPENGSLGHSFTEVLRQYASTYASGTRT